MLHRIYSIQSNTGTCKETGKCDPSLWKETVKWTRPRYGPNIEIIREGF